MNIDRFLAIMLQLLIASIMLGMYLHSGYIASCAFSFGMAALMTLDFFAGRDRP